VAYIARTNSANEHGYASVLVFTARDSNRFELEDFEAVVSSFRYFSAKSASTIPGDEIPFMTCREGSIPRSGPRIFNSTGDDISIADSSEIVLREGVNHGTGGGGVTAVLMGP